MHLKAFWTPLDYFLKMRYHNVTHLSFLTGQKVSIVEFDFIDSTSQRKFLIYGCTASICVTVSSIALNRSPEFPFTGMGLYCHEQKLVLAEVSRTTLNSTSHISDWNYTHYVMRSKL